MEPALSSIQVLLQAAEFLERRERGAAAAAGTSVARPASCLAEAEHGYASLCPARRLPRPRKAVGSFRRAQLRRCLEQLKQQVPVGTEHARSTTLSLLHHARLHIQRLEEQELRARRVKDRLRCEQQSLQQRLEQLLSPPGSERTRTDSLDSSRLSEHSGSEGEEVEIDVDGAMFGGDLLASFSTGRDHSYSSSCGPWS
ncbi:max dimerization protein 3 [Rhea pennata]|uniref:max dimerization protein 3 n=1 Tax=Rhea pennata TaxID=8795 RepID=UPI002E266295